MIHFRPLAYLAADLPDWATLGIGGALAVFMFLKNRDDSSKYAERLAELIQVNRELGSDFKEVVQENSRLTATLCERLSSFIDRLERDRIERGHKHP